MSDVIGGNSWQLLDFDEQQTLALRIPSGTILVGLNNNDDSPGDVARSDIFQYIQESFMMVTRRAAFPGKPTGADERPPATATGHITSGLAHTDNLTYKQLYEIVKREAEQERREKYDLMEQMDAMRKQVCGLWENEQLKQRVKEDRIELHQMYQENVILRRERNAFESGLKALEEISKNVADERNELRKEVAQLKEALDGQ